MHVSDACLAIPLECVPGLHLSLPVFAHGRPVLGAQAKDFEFVLSPPNPNLSKSFCFKTCALAILSA